LYRKLRCPWQKKKEELYTSLKSDTESLISYYTQSDRCHNNTVGYVKISARQIREALLQKGYQASDFCENTINNFLNRLNYSLQKIQKCRPLKRIPETDLIFENVFKERKKASLDKKTVSISIDVKDKVKVGELSRGGYNRSGQTIKAYDKDMHWSTTLVPMGILEESSGVGTIVFGNSKETSDFICDSLELWYKERFNDLPAHTSLLIKLDCGPHQGGKRTQFIKRIAKWAAKINKTIHLLYYPPYHSKYNPIERFWAALEQYWNGTLLNTVEKTLATAGNMKWNQQRPCVCFQGQEYKHGVKVNKKEMQIIEKHLIRKEGLEKWDIIIKPTKKLRKLFFG